MPAAVRLKMKAGSHPQFHLHLARWWVTQLSGRYTVRQRMEVSPSQHLFGFMAFRPLQGAAVTGFCKKGLRLGRRCLEQTGQKVPTPPGPWPFLMQRKVGMQPVIQLNTADEAALIHTTPTITSARQASSSQWWKLNGIPLQRREGTWLQTIYGIIYGTAGIAAFRIRFAANWLGIA